MLNIYIYFFISIIIHELSHIVIAKLFKMNLKNLRVSIFGASLEMEKNFKNKSNLKIFMYMAGPLSNLLLAFIVYYLNIDTVEKLKMIYTNLSLFIFNLLPIIPLDGGNILREVFKMKMSNLNSNKLSLYISKFNLGLLTFFYSIAILKIKNLSFLILLMYLWYLNFIEEKKIDLMLRTYKALDNNLKHYKREDKILDKI